ncbi:HAMP domain-containing protein [Anabaena cylindrica FACHB-243]|uniref:histidine kinase n=1 Tax=Anabaena cylindrica (strain ATCC 27899 / PCC 7122) TaxID=272123 RepID=K9ZIR0_ANACC|nr:MULTISPECIES: ATP-binding protein [Anabaena]AFZ59091.1 integral membrane sensor signal transduction histidine kinase [Anabaena cylindrica PCC 7122]MBD2420570.1 HAMP domain-containing protein [Anabaena cylindrica FACHB-243]MBY5284435.1 HAMP domain-containing protein [Anabaena sp. CCAP 1446/1C]MBY5309000.1 HAMP domain-containing protein [Anabaena sp. CCAP 1446/1C]MCM2408528.1 ATP-binding protein [Anabaena sp. CCAP 1446/1C]
MIDVAKQKIKGVFLWFSYLSNNWNIAEKISYGYTITISIAAIGTFSGLVIANHYERTAQNQLFLSYQQQSLLQDLKNAVITVRLHPQRLATVLDSSIWFELEKNRFLSDISLVNKQLSELKNFIKANPHSLAINNHDLTTLAEKYKINTNLYTQIVENFWLQIGSNNLSLEEIDNSSEQKLISLLNNKKYRDINIKFEQLSDDLIVVIQRADIQRKQSNVSFKNAEKLRIQIILGSIFLSSIMAAILAFFTTKLITHPLKAVTRTARKITEESNFQLRADVSSNDEVGTLAKSLNRLVEWVGEYTQQLELARKILEQRVEERTQELQQAQRTLEQRVEERTQELQQALQELKDTQGQLIQTEKMSSLGEMVAGIAHEINNPVNFIYGNIQYTEDYLQDLVDLINLYQQQYPHENLIIEEKIAEIDLEFLNEDLSKMLSSIRMGAQRIREIVLSLRNFSRLDESEIKDVDIHEGINNTLLILNHRLNREVVVIKNYGNLPLIDCYPAQLNQVFMNILSNAIDALIDHKEQPNKQILISTSKVDDNHIQVKIRDNGLGIPAEIINKLFDPFFTTKPVGKGTGLGLSICYQIIEKHKGKIEVVSAITQGTEFAITLPIKHIIRVC